MPSAAVTLDWRCEGEDFLSGRYSRAHSLSFDGGAVIAGSSSPSVVPTPLSDEAGVDPEEMFVASLSACHMLWFLDFARRSGADVVGYTDQASGELAEDGRGRTAITRVTLRPRVRFADPFVPAKLVKALHEQAHAACFIANSVTTEILVSPVAADPQEETRHG